MAVKERHLLLHGSLDREPILDILLRSVLDTDETKAQLNLLVHDRALGISAAIHNINLGDYTNCTDTLWVNTSRHTQTLLDGHICIGRNNTEDDRSRVTNIALSHATSDLFNIIRLALDRDQRDTGQIDKREVWASVRVDVENNGVVNDVGASATNFVCKFDNHITDLLEVGKFPSLNLLRELGPRLGAVCLMVKTQLKGSTGDETITTRQEVEADDRLEDRRLTSRLGAKHCNTGQLDKLLDAHVSQIVLLTSARRVEGHYSSQ